MYTAGEDLACVDHTQQMGLCVHVCLVTWSDDDLGTGMLLCAFITCFGWVLTQQMVPQ